MDGRGMLLVAGLAAAVAVPYVMTTKDQAEEGNRGFFNSLWSETTDGQPSLAFDPQSSATTATGWAAPQTHAGLQASALTGYGMSAAGSPQTPAPDYRDPAQSLAELLRFDRTPPWVMNRWSRVSTQIRSGDLSGLRVTMISGLSMYDLAGSLTYYFDAQQQLQRIELEAATGDPRQLVTFVTRHYGLESEPACGGQLYLKKNGQAVSSALLVELAPVVRSSQPHQRYRVRLELGRPGSSAPISEGFQELLDGDKKGASKE